MRWYLTYLLYNVNENAPSIQGNIFLFKKKTPERRDPWGKRCTGAIAPWEVNPFSFKRG
jgi:hypothetical protein